MWHRDMKWANPVGKTLLIDLPDPGLPQTFSLYKTHYLQSEIKQGYLHINQKWSYKDLINDFPVKWPRKTSYDQYITIIKYYLLYYIKL